MSSPRLGVMFLRRIVNRSLLHIQITLSQSPSSSFLGLISNQTPKFFSTNQAGNKKSSLDYKLGELLLNLKKAFIQQQCL